MPPTTISTSSAAQQSGRPVAEGRCTITDHETNNTLCQDITHTQGFKSVASALSVSGDPSTVKCVFFMQDKRIRCLFIDTSDDQIEFTEAPANNSLTLSLSKGDYGISVSELYSRVKQALWPSDDSLTRKPNARVYTRRQEVIELSQEQECDVCLQKIKEKPVQEQQFGILENCKHCFCLFCIRSWRDTRQLKKEIEISCPMCRTPSNFIYPSRFWLGTNDEKNNYIKVFKYYLSTIDCSYFNRGSGFCPRGSQCLYLHKLIDDNKTDAGAVVQQTTYRTYRDIVAHLHGNGKINFLKFRFPDMQVVIDTNEYRFCVCYNEMEGFWIEEDK